MALLWMLNKYGNGGACHTKENQAFITRLLEDKFDDAERIRVRASLECCMAVERIERNDYSELRQDQRKMLEAVQGETMDGQKEKTE